MLPFLAMALEPHGINFPKEVERWDLHHEDMIRDPKPVAVVGLSTASDSFKANGSNA